MSDEPMEKALDELELLRAQLLILKTDAQKLALLVDMFFTDPTPAGMEGMGDKAIRELAKKILKDAQ